MCRAEQLWCATSLQPLAMFCLVQPWVPLYFVSRSSCWLMFTFLSSRTPRAFLHQTALQQFYRADFGHKYVWIFSCNLQSVSPSFCRSPCTRALMFRRSCFLQWKQWSLLLGDKDKELCLCSALATESRDRVSTDKEVTAWDSLQNTMSCQKSAILHNMGKNKHTN